jgi:subtilase family serine protease
VKKKYLVIGTGVLTAALAVAAVVAAPLRFAAHASSSLPASPLQFAPAQIIDAPADASQSTGGSYACTTPAPEYHYTYYHCYTPAQIMAAYGVDKLHAAGWTGKGETIVIVDSYGSPTAQSDLDYFSDTFNLPRTTIEIVHPTGTPPFNNSVNGSPAGWAFETSLDLQWAHAIAPDAHLVLVAANPAETEGVQGFPSIFIGEQYAVTHYPGSVISQSFAVTEQSFNGAADVQVAKFDEVYRQAVANHVTVLGSSGDSGTANVDKQNRVYPFPTVNWPSSDPLVTSAGGTWLQYGWTWNPQVTANTFYACLNAGTPFKTCAATYLSYTTNPGVSTEAVWKEDWLPAAGGGGRSVLFPTPSFQSSISQGLLQGSRGLPDVSWNAAVDGGVLVHTGFPGVRVGWHVVGGTSAASPQLAGLVALTNQMRRANHKQPIGYLNPVLYTMPASDFNDIVPQTFGTGAGVTTLDSNAQYGSGIAGMAVTSGYDLATGFGSPKADLLVPDLAATP